MQISLSRFFFVFYTRGIQKVQGFDVNFSRVTVSRVSRNIRFVIASGDISDEALSVSDR